MLPKKTSRFKTAPHIVTIAIVVILTPSLGVAGGPSTPDEWRQMRDACVEGVRQVPQMKGLGAAFPEAFCACVQKSLQETPTSEWNKAFPNIQERCITTASNSVKAGLSDWPENGISNAMAVCHKQPGADVPAQSLNDYCKCYVSLVSKNISWHDWQLADSAVSTKGLGSIGTQEKTIFGRALEDGYYCFLKHVPPSGASQRR